MTKKMPAAESANHIAVFQEKTIRRTWHKEKWWFSVSDVCGVLTDSADAGAYWRKLKQRLAAEGSEVVTFCHGLKLEAPDGKRGGVSEHRPGAVSFSLGAAAEPQLSKKSAPRRPPSCSTVSNRGLRWPLWSAC